MRGFNQIAIQATLCCWLLLVATVSSAQRVGRDSEEHEFAVTPNEAYADFIQDAEGKAQGVVVFYFDVPVNGLNRAVIFCRGDSPVGTATEDQSEKRLVITRPLADFPSLCRFQHEHQGNVIYGAWETTTDGVVVKFAVQLYRAARTERKREELPLLAAERVESSREKKPRARQHRD